MKWLLFLTLFVVTHLTRAQSPVDILKKTDSLQWNNNKEKRSELKGVLPFELNDGILRLSEKFAGNLLFPTDDQPRHVVLEFKWGERTSPHQETSARRAQTTIGAGVVLLRESMSGDLLVPQAEGSLNLKSKTYDPSVPNQRGAHTRNNQIESSFGRWNRLELIAKSHRFIVKLNGQQVNEAKLARPLQPNVTVATAFTELFVRRWQVYPVGAFEEPWEPNLASTDTGYSSNGESILPRDYPLSPEASLANWHVDGDYELQLVAAEPLTCDPVDIAWDTRGRLFVAEMRDYPLPTEHGGYLSRIRLLTDTNGDGVMDEASTWADHLDHVQGLTPHRDGFIVTTRTAILYLADTDGDDRADVTKSLFHSNDPRYNQLQVSSPRRGLNNWIYLNNGIDLKEIYPDGSPASILKINKTNIRIHPETGTLEAVTGYGQFGATQDNFGRRIFSLNRNPAMMAVMPLEYLKRNPFAGITQGHEDIAPFGEDAKVFPLELSHTTSIAHAGTHTAACGLAIYRGNAIPELKGDLFVCEPTAQLVTRSRLKENGASLRAERVGKKVDFLVSGDEWSRPVNLRNGPDGCLYLCDMYRRFIDHSRFFPEAFAESHYMRAGFDHGRIYRLVPKGHPPLPASELPSTQEKLVELLTHENAWQRIHAQRLLVESEHPSVAPLLDSLLERNIAPEARAHALGALLGIGKLNEDHLHLAVANPTSGVSENAILNLQPGQARNELIEVVKARKGRASFLALLALGNDPSDEITELFQYTLHNTPEGTDPWVRRAVLSGSKERSGAILAHMLTHPITGIPGNGFGPERAVMYQEFAAAVAARGNGEEIALVLKALAQVDGDDYRLAITRGFADGMRRTTLPTKSLAAFLARPPEACAESIQALSEIVDSAATLAADTKQSPKTRVAALEIANQQDFVTVREMVEMMVAPNEPDEVQKSAVRSLRRFSKNRKEVASFLFERWSTLPPPSRSAAIEILTSNNDSARLLMEEMKAGNIRPSVMPPMKQWVYGRSSVPEIKSLAGELFGKTASSRNAVIEEYLPALSSHASNRENGAKALQKGTCLACHRIDGKGSAVGPDLADVRAKPRAALLTDILDPNRAVEERWIAYAIELRDGTTATGLVDSEDDQSVTLKTPGGMTQTFARTDIKTMSSTETSLMPVGLEAALPPEDMADLIDLLKNR